MSPALHTSQLKNHSDQANLTKDDVYIKAQIETHAPDMSADLESITVQYRNFIIDYS